MKVFLLCQYTGYTVETVSAVQTRGHRVPNRSQEYSLCSNVNHGSNLNDTLTTWMVRAAEFWGGLGKSTNCIDSGLSLQYNWSQLLNISLITRFPVRFRIQCCFKLCNFIFISGELLRSPSSNTIEMFVSLFILALCDWFIEYDLYSLWFCNFGN